MVDNGVDLGHLVCGKGNHVSLLAWDGNGELLVTDGGLDLGQQEGKVFNLLYLLVVGDLLVVLA